MIDHPKRSGKTKLFPRLIRCLSFLGKYETRPFNLANKTLCILTVYIIITLFFSFVLSSLG